MKQTGLGLDLNTRHPRRQVSLKEMNYVRPWADMLALIAPHAPVANTGRPPFDLAMMLRIPDRVSILRVRHLLKEHALRPKILQVINAELAAHGLLRKTGTVVDAQSGLVHTIIATAANVNDVTQGHAPGRAAHALGRVARTSRETKASVRAKVRYRGLAKNTA